MSEDDLKSLNSGIKCPDIDTQNTYCHGSCFDKVASAIKTTPTAVTPTVTQKPTTTKQPSGNGVKTPEAIQEGMISNCNKFHYMSPTTTCQGILNYNKITLADFFKWNPAIVKDTTTCQGILNYNKITLADFIKWNPAVSKDCSGLWKGTSACVGVIGSTPSPTTTSKPKPSTTTPANGIKTPPAIQEGMVANCNKFHEVRDTTTCQGIVEYNKITLADFIKWNCCSKPQPTATAPSNGIKTPSPIQDGMVKNCITFHYISSTTTCQALLKYRKITMEQFFKWNPAVKKDCSGLWKDTNACVAVK
ncbi:Autolysin [Fusarium coicis]|nr:Autolysin [Fusarium coicis]